MQYLISCWRQVCRSIKFADGLDNHNAMRHILFITQRVIKKQAIFYYIRDCVLNTLPKGVAHQRAKKKNQRRRKMTEKATTQETSEKVVPAATPKTAH